VPYADATRDFVVVTRLLLLRHGQSTWNAENRWQGSADAPLSSLGERQAADAAAHLAGVGITRVASSALQRANRTATIIAAILGLGVVVVEADLRERHVGAFTGKTMEEIRATWPDSFDPVSRRLIHVPDGEDDAAVLGRALPALCGLARRFSRDRLLVISHGGLIRALERHLGTEPPASTPNLGGRWLDVDGENEVVVPGESYTPVEPELATAPGTE